MVFLSSDFPLSFFLSEIVSHPARPSPLTFQTLFHPSHCSPLLMFNSPPALPRLTSPCVIPLSALCFRLVLITPPPRHGRVWNWLRPWHPAPHEAPPQLRQHSASCNLHALQTLLCFGLPTQKVLGCVLSSNAKTEDLRSFFSFIIICLANIF